MIRRRHLLLVPALALLPAATARADEIVYDDHGTEIRVGGELDLYLTANPGAQFGAGGFKPDGSRLATDPVWTEGVVMPHLRLDQDTPAGTFYGMVQPVFTYTVGDGDANLTATTYWDPNHLAIQQLKAGWRSGDLLPELGHDAITAEGGQFEFRAYDGWLIGDGTNDGSNRAAYWYAPRKSFRGLGVVSLNTEPVRADFFAVNNDVDQQLMRNGDEAATAVVGFDVQWFGSDPDGTGRFGYNGMNWALSLTYAHVYDADTTRDPQRQGLNTFALQWAGPVLDSLPDLDLLGAFAYQFNDRSNARVRAKAWYAGAQYTASDLPWQPTLIYRYSQFSGDGDPNNDIDGTYDSLFLDTGYTPALQTWTQGNIADDYVIANNNQNTHQVGLRLSPTESLDLYAIYYDISYNSLSAVGAAISDAQVMQEVDFSASWQATEWLNLSGGLDIAWAGAGYQQVLRSQTAPGTPVDETWYLLQAVASLSF